MMIWQVARDLTRRLPEWDASAKLSLAIAILLLLLLLGVGFLGPDAVQFPARIGAFALLVTIQFLFLWGNRREASPYHQAQKHFIAQDYQAARELLEALPVGGRASVDALVLLGNTYRHLGQLDRAQTALTRALEIKPGHDLALFSAGKLNLVRGQYAAAIEYIECAIKAGAPEIVRFELGQARFLLGRDAEAAQQLTAARSALADDPAQLLFLQYYLWSLGAGDMPAKEFIRENIEYWRGEAQKYSDTLYGAHLSDVERELCRTFDTN
ncbi:MAG: tetratricopeptide repeat protein [Chloroflexi bacterium]|nr:tetratricopeptide repeat protein [Chloroflexota bacterium]